MQYPNTQPVDIDAYHDAISAAFKLIFPAFATVGCYERIDALPATPALIFGLSEITPAGGDIGTEQVAATFAWDAFIIIDALDDAAARKRAFVFAGQLLAFLRSGCRFGQPVSCPRVSGAFPEAIAFGGDNAREWNNASAVCAVRVSWEQDGLLALNVHEGDPSAPIFKQGIPLEK